MSILFNQYNGGNINSEDAAAAGIGLVEEKGGDQFVTVRADDYDSGTVKMQWLTKEDNLNRWADIANTAFMADGQVTLESLPNAIELRANLTGSNGSVVNLHVSVLSAG